MMGTVKTPLLDTKTLIQESVSIINIQFSQKYCFVKK